MSEPLKPLSEAQRAMLALLGEKPAAFQEKVMKVKLYGTKSLKALDTKDPVWKKNKDTLAKMNGTKPIQEVVASMQATEEKAKAFTLSDWIPLHYTMFTRRIYCKYCRTWESSMEHGTIFLCHRKRGGSTERLYLPVKAISHHQLKRFIETSLSTTEFCPQCFLKERPVWQESFSPPAGTESSQGEGASPQESTITSSTLAQTPTPQSDTSAEESVGSPASSTESQQPEELKSSSNTENSASASSNPRLLPVLVSVYDFLTGGQVPVMKPKFGEI